MRKSTAYNIEDLNLPTSTLCVKLGLSKSRVNAIKQKHGMQSKRGRPLKERSSWERYFMDIAYLVAQRSTCLRRKVGAVAVKDRRVLATGYNGAPSGCMHCDEAGCLRQQLNIPSGQRQEICRAVHAEQNVIVQAAKHGISLEGAELYCTTLPCITCAKMLLNVGIHRIYVVEGYPDEFTEELIKQHVLEVVYLKDDSDAQVRS